MFKLRFKESRIRYWADRYDNPGEERITEEIGPVAQKRGYLTRREFVEMCHWKTPRTQKLVKANSRALVEAVTQAALESQNEAVKIMVLQALKGVAWPTASVILHFCDEQPYPILDVRALESLGMLTKEGKPPPYTLEFWLDYVAYVRGLAQRTGHSMRTVDRALWQFSKDRPKR